MAMNPRLLRPVQSAIPKQIAGLAAWFDAADASTVTLGTGVLEWRDKSGNNRHASQEVINDQPNYTGTLNGRNIITFDGLSDSLATTAFVIPQPYSILMIARRTGGGSQNFYDRISNGASFGTFGGVFFISAGVGLNGPSQDTNYHIFHAKHNGSSSVFRVDKSNASTGNTGTQSIDQGLRLGSRGDGAGNFMNGSIAELVIYSKILSDAEQSKIENYLSRKWAVA